MDRDDLPSFGNSSDINMAAWCICIVLRDWFDIVLGLRGERAREGDSFRLGIAERVLVTVGPGEGCWPCGAKVFIRV